MTESEGTTPTTTSGNKQLPVNDWEQLASGLRNYSTWLSPTGVQMSDIDGCLHASTAKGDRFLILEFKPAGHRVPIGQKIMLAALRKIPNFTVATVYGPDKDGLFVCGLDWSGKITKEDLAAKVQRWWECAKEC